MKLSSLTIAAGLGLVALAPSAFSASPAGHIPNALVDRVLTVPLKEADSVWDLFQVLNNWLSETYPAEGDARTAIDGFDSFIKKFNTEEAKDIRVPRTVEMPMSVDTYVRLLRKEAPGSGGNKIHEKLKGNVKAQLYTAGLLPFLQMRGIAYRLRPLVAQSFVLHTAAVNNLRRMKQDLRVRAGNNGLAIFEFLTYPMAGRKREMIQFTRFSELQHWVKGQLIPTLDVSIEMAESALAQMKPNQRESMDLTIFMKGDNPFPDASKEMSHRYFSKAEVHSFVARLHRYRAVAGLFTAYHLDEFPAVSNKLRDVLTKAFFKEKIPFANLKKKPRTGSPPIVKYTIVKQFGRFLTLKDGSAGPEALKHGRLAWKHWRTATDMYYAESPDAGRIVNLDWVQASQKDFKTKVAPQIDAVLAGPASVTDYVGGTTVDVDFPGFLSNLPADLKSFFPSEFVEQHPYWEFEFSSGKLAYTNYDYGTPVGWDKQAAGDSWAKLFPTIPMETNEKGHWDAPLWKFRDIGRTYLGGLVGPVLGSVVY